MKEYQATRGIQMDESFPAHVASGCEQCRRFDAGKPATAALMCLEGSVLYKRDNATRKPAERASRPSTFASKAEVKRLMKYKGDPA